MLNAKQVVHLFFLDGERNLPLRGIYRLRATEAHLYYTRAVEKPQFPVEVERNIAVHRKLLSDRLSDAIEDVSNDLEDLLTEDMLVCVNLDGGQPLIAEAAILVLSEFLSDFHQHVRPCLGPSATVLYYHVKGESIEGYPIIPDKPSLCFPIFRILSRSGEKWQSKKQILRQLNDIDDMITDHQLTNALLILENWLRLFPGFQIRQTSQHKKEYRITGFDNI